MGKTERKEKNKLYGLLGKNISYSFSSGYFTEKFDSLGLNDSKYVNFDIETIIDFKKVYTDYASVLHGMNVTIPYKQQIIPYLDILDAVADEIGAVNTIKFTKNGKLKGYNTDIYGFQKSLEPLLENFHQKALILGTGGASKSVVYVLKKLSIDVLIVSRKPTNENEISYDQITENIMEDYNIIINCTPLGTFPETDKCPDIPYEFITNKHLLYDLIYNPSMTTFLKKGKEKGAILKNGFDMLQLQAEKSWEIWNE